MEQRKKWKWSQFGELCNCQDLEDYLTGREYTHGQYFHYTKLDIVDSILKNKKFWLSNVDGFNDTLDIKQFGQDPVPCFSLCFSTGIHENLPLWYLYSGLDGRGARICFTKTGIKKLVKNGRYSLRLFGPNEDQDGKEIMSLEDGKTMKLSFRDVIYFQSGDSKGKCALKYNTMTNYKIETEEFENYSQKNRGFQKGLIWYYEKETRLLVELLGDAKKVWEEKSKENTIRVILSFDETLLKHIRVTLAPNIALSDKDDVLKDKEGICELMEKTAVVQLSKYVGTINMRLCDRCKLKKNKQINKESTNV